MSEWSDLLSSSLTSFAGFVLRMGETALTAIAKVFRKFAPISLETATAAVASAQQAISAADKANDPFNLGKPTRADIPLVSDLPSKYRYIADVEYECAGENYPRFYTVIIDSNSLLSKTDITSEALAAFEDLPPKEIGSPPLPPDCAPTPFRVTTRTIERSA